MLKNSLFKWLRLSCLTYFIISFSMNMIYWITSQRSTIMLFNHNLVILLFTFLVVAIVCILMYKPKPNTIAPRLPLLIAYRFSVFYTLISFSLRIYALIDTEKSSVIDDSYMLLIITGIAIVISLCITFIKIDNYLLKSIFYFIVLGLAWISIFIFKINYTDNSAIIAILVYIGLYLITAISFYFLYARRKHIKQNENKKYKSLFK